MPRALNWLLVLDVINNHRVTFIRLFLFITKNVSLITSTTYHFHYKMKRMTTETTSSFSGVNMAEGSDFWMMDWGDQEASSSFFILSPRLSHVFYAVCS